METQQINRRDFLKAMTTALIAARIPVSLTQRPIYAQIIGPKPDGIVDQFWTMGLKWLDYDGKLYGSAWRISDNIFEDHKEEEIIKMMQDALEKETGNKFILGR
jgi:hypothetical protein